VLASRLDRLKCNLRWKQEVTRATACARATGPPAMTDAEPPPRMAGVIGRFCWRVMVTMCGVFLVIGACVAGAFLAYFFDRPTPPQMGVLRPLFCPVVGC
jgi:hypothetical protein